MKKIFIIGGGIFGVTAYLILKNTGFNCSLIEKNKEILGGASSANLNRVHWGYHYPRDKKTAEQSLRGYKSFAKFYRKSVLFDFDNYYMISKKKSLINFKQFLMFCKKVGLNYEVTNKIKYFEKIKNIEGIIKVKEPIYSWTLIKNEIKKKIRKIKKNSIIKNEKVLKIIRENNKYSIYTNKNKYISDIIIDGTYLSLESSLKNTRFKKKTSYQITIIPEFILKSIKKRVGVAIMDGPFFSFLPKGKSQDHLFYHVKYSIINKSINNLEINKKKNKYYFKKYEIFRKKIRLSFKFFFPNTKIKFKNKFNISRRVILKNKNDRRVSQLAEIKKNYFLIYSGKIDHSVEIAEKIKNIFLKRNNYI